MLPLLATSYDGLYEGLAGWNGIALLLAGVAVLLARTNKKMGIVCGMVVAVGDCIFVLPPAFFVAAASQGGGPIDSEWMGLIVLTLGACGSAGGALVYSLRRYGAYRTKE